MIDAKHISETCALLRMRRTARRVTRLYETALAPLDMTASQFSVLVAVGRQEGVTVTELAERLGMDRTTLTRVLAPMERRDWITQDAVKGDRRAKAVAFGLDGRAALTQAAEYWKAAQAQALRGMNEAEWKSLGARLDAIAGGAD